MVRQRADVGDGEADIFGQLTLNSRVHLVNHGPLIVFRDGFDAGRGQEAGTCRAIGVRKRVSIRE